MNQAHKAARRRKLADPTLTMGAVATDRMSPKRQDARIPGDTKFPANPPPNRMSKARQSSTDPADSKTGDMVDQCVKAGESCDRSRTRELSKAQNPDQSPVDVETGVGPDAVEAFWPLRHPSGMNAAGRARYEQLKKARGRSL